MPNDTTTDPAEKICAIVWHVDRHGDILHAVALRRGDGTQSEEARYRDQALCGRPQAQLAGKALADDPQPRCAVCTAAMNSDPFERVEQLHRITTRSDGPDLDDLVRLTKYLRDNNIVPSFGTDSSGTRLTVKWMHGPWDIFTFIEGDTVGLGRFVDTNGAIYNAEREAL